MSLIARVALLALVGVVHAGPAAWTPGQPVAAGALTMRPAPVTVILRHDGPVEQGERALVAIAHARFPDVTLRATAEAAPAPSRGPLCHAVSLPAAKQPLPGGEVLDYVARRLTAAERDAVGRYKSVLVLSFLIDPARRADLASVCALAHAVAVELAAYLEDGESHDVFSAEQWKSVRLDSWQGAIPAVAGHLAIRPWKLGEASGVDSVGMRRFGLPDLTVTGVGEEGSSAAAALVLFVAQQLVERPLIDRAGELTVRASALLHARMRAPASKEAPGSARVLLATAGPDADSPNPRRLAIVRAPGDGSVASMVARLMLELIGPPKEVELPPDQDAAIAAASTRAQKRIAELREIYRANHPAGAELLLKAPFATASGGREFMWVEVQRWEPGRIVGKLLNAPSEVPMTSGQSVTVPDDALFDYRFTPAGQPAEGAETDAIIERSAPKNE